MGFYAKGVLNSIAIEVVQNKLASFSVMQEELYSLKEPAGAKGL